MSLIDLFSNIDNSSGDLEYVGSISAEREICPGYDTASGGEALVLDLWGVWSHPVIAITPRSTLRVVVPVKMPSISQIGLLENYLY